MIYLTVTTTAGRVLHSSYSLMLGDTFTELIALLLEVADMGGPLTEHAKVAE